MKLLYLHQYFLEPHTGRGGGTRSFELARRLAAAGHEVHVVSADLKVERKTWTTTETGGFAVHRIGVRYDNSLSYRERIAAFTRFAAAAGPRAASLGGELVFATSTPLTIALPGIFAARRLGAPFVFEVRDLWPALPIALGALQNPAAIAAARALERLAYREADHVVALSPGMRAGVLAHGLAPAQVSMIPNGCDFELFEVDPALGQRWRARQAWLGDRPLLAYAGTLGKANGAGWLVELAAALRRRGSPACIAVAGGGWERDAIVSRAAACGVLDDNFFMLGTLAKAEVPALLSAASGCLSTFLPHPALRDNSANKFFDALAAGKPVFLNHEGWLADLVRARGCGLALPRNPSAAAEQLAERLSDRAWLAEAGAAAAALGRERFDRDDHAQALDAIFRAVRSSSHRRPARAA